MNATYTTVRVDAAGKPLTGAPVRTYRAESAAEAAELAARADMTDAEWENVKAGSATDVEGTETWFFVPSVGSPVRIVVREVVAAPQVVARTERLDPVNHPYRAGEVVEYVGPTTDATAGLRAQVARFHRMHAPGVAVVIAGAGAYAVEVADLRRPKHNLAVELTPRDIARIFQALCQETDRLTDLPDSNLAAVHAKELRDRFAALHP